MPDSYSQYDHIMSLICARSIRDKLMLSRTKLAARRLRQKSKTDAVKVSVCRVYLENCVRIDV